MPYNGSGTFVISTSGQPVVTGTVISSTAFNALTADLATGLSTCITKDGQTTTTQRIVFAQGISSSLTTDATSVTTGSIITAGGISTEKALWVGGLANIAGAVTLQTTLGVTGASTLANVGAGIAPTNRLTVVSGNDNIPGDSLALPTARVVGPNIALNAADPAGLFSVCSNTAMAVDVGGSVALGGRYNGSTQAVFGIVKGAKENGTSGNFAGYLAFGTREAGGLVTEKARLSSTGTFTVQGGIVATTATLSSLTSGRVPYATTGGLLTDSANLTFDGTTIGLTSGRVIAWNSDASLSRISAGVVGVGTGAAGSTAGTIQAATAIIPSLVPGANLVLTQNSVAAFTSVESGAVANTLYMTGGKVGIKTTSLVTDFTVYSASTNAVPTLGTASGRFSLIGDSGLYGLYAGLASSGDTWFQAMRNDSAVAYNLLLNPSGGRVGIGGVPAASALLDLTSTTGALLVPRMTTAQKNALTAENGMIVYDTDLGKFQGREAGAWTSFI